MIPYSHKYYILYFQFFNSCFLFTASKRHFVNQHILLKLSAENITSGDKKMVLIAESICKGNYHKMKITKKLNSNISEIAYRKLLKFLTAPLKFSVNIQRLNF